MPALLTSSKACFLISSSCLPFAVCMLWEGHSSICFLYLIPSSSCLFAEAISDEEIQVFLFHTLLLLMRQNQVILIRPSSLRCFHPFFPCVSLNAIIWCLPAPLPASWFWFLLLCLFLSFFQAYAGRVDICMLVMVFTQVLHIALPIFIWQQP